MEKWRPLITNPIVRIRNQRAAAWRRADWNGYASCPGCWTICIANFPLPTDQSEWSFSCMKMNTSRGSMLAFCSRFRAILAYSAVFIASLLPRLIVISIRTMLSDLDISLNFDGKRSRLGHNPEPSWQVLLRACQYRQRGRHESQKQFFILDRLMSPLWRLFVRLAWCSPFSARRTISHSS